MARIILGNDDADLLDLCRSLLEDEGHTVETRENGRQVVERARTWHPDLVLLDWVMPEMDGGTATRALRSHPSTASIPILMMSGSPEGPAQAREAGADAFLAKPFGADRLLGDVAALLRAPTGGQTDGDDHDFARRERRAGGGTVRRH